MYLLRALFALLLLAGPAQAWRHGNATFNPTFSPPGIPCGSIYVSTCDYPTGRTSTNQFRVAVSNGSDVLSNFSASSITIGTGAKVATIDTSLSAFDPTDLITLTSRANSANFISGTVTSLVGTTLTMNITSVGGSGTFSDWDCTHHLPAGSGYDAGVSGIRIGSNSAPITVTDWDFDGVNAVIYIQQSQHVSFVQTRFGLSNFSFVNAPYIATRSGSATYSLTNVTIEGYSSFVGGATMALGNGLLSCSYCWIKNWPGSDVYNGAGVAGQATTLEYSVFDNVSTLDGSHGLHSDFSQLNLRAGTALNIHHVIATLPTTTPPGGTDVDSILLWSSINGAWDATTSINNVIFYGGGYVIHVFQGANPANAPVAFGENVYFGAWAFGPTYTTDAPLSSLSITGIKSLTTGLPVQFTLDGVSYFSYP